MLTHLKIYAPNFDESPSSVQGGGKNVYFVPEFIIVSSDLGGGGVRIGFGKCPKLYNVRIRIAFLNYLFI